MHRFSNCKGASEVIAALLMIVIAVAASLLLYGYVSGLMGTLQGVAVRQTYLESLAFEYYDWTTTNALKLTLRNVGSATINIGAAAWFINGVSQTQSGCTGNLAPQTGVCTATITPAGSILPIQAGTAYDVEVATQDGAILSSSCIAGQRTGSVPYAANSVLF